MQKEPYDILISDTEFIALDFETTGLKPQNSRVIEIGMAKIVNGEITETFSSFVNPGMPVPPQITALTGISDDDLFSAPPFENIIPEIKNFISDCPIIAHNAPFDMAFLQSEFARAETEPPQNSAICTAQLARRLFPELQKKNLASVSRYLNIRNVRMHRALSDAVTAAKVFLKMLPRLEEEFGIRTVRQLLKFQSIPQKSVRVKFVKKSLLEDLGGVSDSPGVYFYKDKTGKIIYVGKAKSLKKRLGSYFLATTNKKAKQIVRKAKNLEFSETRTELTALLAETKLIKKYDPEFNSQLKKFPQTHFIRIDISKEFPRPAIAGNLKSDGADYFGPFRNRDTAHAILDIVNKAFLLRECTEKDFKKEKSCYLAEINRCIEPCIFKDKERYAKELAKVYEFLSGENQTALNILLVKMKRFSEQKQFERAAELRDAAQTLLAHLKRAAILAEPINRANAVVEISGRNGNDYLLFKSGKFFIKNDITESRDLFTDALNDYFENSISVDSEIRAEDIEYFKIALSWLNQHRDLIKIYYLKNYGSKEELFFDMNLTGSK